LKFHSKTILLAALLSCSSFPVLAQKVDNPGRDSQIWPDVTATIRLDDKYSLLLFGTIRFGRDDSALVSHQAGVGVSRKFNKYLTGTAQYRYVSNEPTPNKQSTEHRLFADLTPRIPLKFGIQISDRNRIEWRDINDKVSWRYRNRVQFERSINIGEHKITPYISGESQYDSRYDNWTRNQFYLGTRVPIVKHFTLDGFYMRQWDARSKPGFLHVVGTFIRLDF
jgi:hypothetical protein